VTNAHWPCVPAPVACEIVASSSDALAHLEVFFAINAIDLLMVRSLTFAAEQKPRYGDSRSDGIHVQ
jgi:hypothetical protein